MVARRAITPRPSSRRRLPRPKAALRVPMGSAVPRGGAPPCGECPTSAAPAARTRDASHEALQDFPSLRLQRLSVRSCVKRLPDQVATSIAASASLTESGDSSSLASALITTIWNRQHAAKQTTLWNRLMLPYDGAVRQPRYEHHALFRPRCTLTRHSTMPSRGFHAAIDSATLHADTLHATKRDTRKRCHDKEAHEDKCVSLAGVDGARNQGAQVMKQISTKDISSRRPRPRASRRKDLRRSQPKTNRPKGCND